MANTKISALTSATTPLAGTEVLPIVQSSATVKVAVSDLTAGRSISVSGLTNTGLTASKPVFTDASKLLTSTGVVPVANGGTDASVAGITAFNNITGYTASGATGTTSTNLVFSTSSTLTTPKATTTIGVGNATPSASGAGITFPATQSGSSDSNTLDDYEEGTWTPTVFHNSVQVTSLGTATGIYVKIGTMVYLAGYANKTSGADLATGTWELRNLPFTVGGTNGYPICTFNGAINSTGTSDGAWNSSSGTDTKLTLTNSTLNSTAWASGFFELYATGCFVAF